MSTLTETDIDGLVDTEIAPVCEMTCSYYNPFTRTWAGEERCDNQAVWTVLFHRCPDGHKTMLLCQPCLDEMIEFFADGTAQCMDCGMADGPTDRWLKVVAKL